MIKGKKLSLLEKAVLFGIGIASLFTGAKVMADSNEGALDIQSFLGSQASEDTAMVVRFSNSYDKLSSSPIIIGQHNVTSFFGGQDNWYDQRPADSNTPFDIRLIHNGTTKSKTSKLKFNFPLADYKFGTKPILFQSTRLPYGPVVDLRRAMALAPDPNEVEIPLIDVPIETAREYGSGWLDIGTRILADLDDKSRVDLRDFAILAKDWKNSRIGGVAQQGQYVADISGPNGIPDGYVNGHDLSVFCKDWLRDVNDL